MINTALKLEIIMDLYEFEYHFLPYLVNECSQRKLDPRALAGKNFIKETVEAIVKTCLGTGMTSR